MSVEDPIRTSPIKSQALQPVRGTLALTDEELTWGQYCHFAGVFGWLGTLICWLMKKDQSKYLDAQGKSALNFHITNVICMAVCAITLIGIPVAIALNFYGIIMSILAGAKAKDGEIYQYPFSFQLVK